MFWFREIIGWVLVIGALMLVVMGVEHLRHEPTGQVIEGGLCMIGAGIVMRAGIMLVRVSTAARIVRDETKLK